MIPVSPAPEPPGFDEEVRQPGLAALDRLAARYGGSREAIPASEFPPLWRNSLDDLLDRYNRICSCLCLYISRATGARSVDHFVAKPTAWQHAYEWHSYRLACGLMNARKGSASSVLDPFDVQEGWFVLDAVSFQVAPGDGLEAATMEAVNVTISRLRLNDQECCEARAEFAEDYWNGEVTYGYVARHAPFVAQELRRLGRLLPADA